MVRVMAQGVFDLLHLGHVHYLCRAKELGDELVVVVASDATVRRRKHEPITPGEMRVELVGALRCVDRAVLGSEGGDPYAIVEELRPDIIALGYDQEHDEREISAELKRRHLPTRVVRLDYYDHDLDGTRKIISKILSMWSISKEIERIEERPAAGKKAPKAGAGSKTRAKMRAKGPKKGGRRRG
jgi:FAD synthetase